MELWQIVLLAFLFLLPMVLMLDYWGSERVDFRGRPLPRPWQRQTSDPLSDDDDHH